MAAGHGHDINFVFKRNCLFIREGQERIIKYLNSVQLYLIIC